MTRDIKRAWAFVGASGMSSSTVYPIEPPSQTIYQSTRKPNLELKENFGSTRRHWYFAKKDKRSSKMREAVSRPI